MPVMVPFFKELESPVIRPKARWRNLGVGGCYGCGLFQFCQSPKMEATGEGKRGLFILAEAPGKNEDEQGIQLVGKSGRLLRRELAELGIDLDRDCIKLNAVNCRPKGNRTPTDAEIAFCRPRVIKAIKDANPRVILALGGAAMKSLTQHRSSWDTGFPPMQNWQGARIPDLDLGCWIVPTWHPAFLMRMDGHAVYERRWREDLRAAVELLDAGPIQRVDYASMVETIVNTEQAANRIQRAYREIKGLPEPLVSFDYETTGLKPYVEGHKAVCCSLAWKNDHAISFMLDNRTWPWLYRILRDADIGKAAHNMKFEQLWTKVRGWPDSKNGFEIRGWKWDSMLAAHILDNRTGRNGLKLQAYLRYGLLGYDDDAGPYIRSGKKDSNAFNKVEQLSPHELLLYCGLDSLLEYKLTVDQMREVKERDLTDACDLFFETALTFVDAEINGIEVDLEFCRKQKAYLERQIKHLKAKMEQYKEVKLWRKMAGAKFSFASPAQLSTLLYKKLGIEPPKTTESGAASVDKSVLEDIDLPFIKDLLHIRQLEKLKSTYLEALTREAPDGTLHPFFHLHKVVSFRTSSSAPNWQNQPKRDAQAQKMIRRALRPRPGFCIFEVDFSSIEVRISECVTGDTKIETIAGQKTIVDVISAVKNGEDVYVYGYNFDDKQVAVAKVTDGGLTRKQAEVWEVTLDNGDVVKATPDHKFLLRSGEYCNLSDLQVGDSLMPFYKTRTKSRYGTIYETVYLNNGKKAKAHNLISKYVFGQEIGKTPFVIHHKDHNGCNNSLENLLLCHRAEHMRIHSIEGWKNKPVGVRKLSIDNFTPEQRERFVHGWKRKWETMTDLEKEEYGRRISDSIRAKGGRAGARNGMYGKKQSEESKQKNRMAHLGKKMGPSWNAGLTKETSESVRKISESNKGRPGWNKGLKGVYVTSEETRQKLRLAMLGKRHTEETKALCTKKKYEYWEKRKQQPKVKCPYCGKEFVAITNTHLSRKHGISFDEYRKTYNHKVVSIRFVGYEDVFNINVEGIHNYAVGAGVIIKNCYHLDPNMKAYLENPHSDMHRDTAMDLCILEEQDVGKYLRQAAKNGFVFAEFYGDWYKACASNIWHKWFNSPDALLADDKTHIKKWLAKKGIRTLEKFTKHVQKVEDIFWNERFPVYNEWREKHWKRYLKKGSFRGHTGFEYTALMQHNDAINYGTQGSACHCLLWSMNQVNAKIRADSLRSYLLGQIHDSMNGGLYPSEINELVPYIIDTMTRRLREHYTWINVPIDVDFEMAPLGGSWYDVKKLTRRDNACDCGLEWGYAKKDDDAVRWTCPVCEHMETIRA